VQLSGSQTLAREGPQVGTRRPSSWYANNPIFCFSSRSHLHFLHVGFGW